MGAKICLFTMTEEKAEVFGNRVLRNISGPKRKGVCNR